MNREATRRLFFALWPDSGVRDSIEEQAQFVRTETDGRAVVASNIHMTLAFLGSMAVDRIAEVRAVCNGVGSKDPTPSLGSGSFALRLDRVGWWKKTGILWLAPSEPPAELDQLVNLLWSRLRPLGFKADIHKFRPHVTIARKCSRASSVEITPIAWPVEKIALLGSETHPKGARYTLLDQWSLEPHPG